MSASFHFLRPWWLLALIPLILFILRLWKHSSAHYHWKKICDAHLLPHLLTTKSNHRHQQTLLLLFLSGIFMCISLAGPTWTRYPVPVFNTIHSRVLVLELSAAMLSKDIAPDRLTRAKFILQDLFKQKVLGQFGLVVFTAQPFTVSPLTEDANTIAALLPDLTPNIMPLDGYNLSTALEQASDLILHAGYQPGQILVLTAAVPDEDSKNRAALLARQGISTSILPLTNDDSASFADFAKAGQGMQLKVDSINRDLKKWLTAGDNQTLTASKQNNFPLWKDEGPWFLLPVFILLLPLFRRGWLKRAKS